MIEELGAAGAAIGVGCENTLGHLVTRGASSEGILGLDAPPDFIQGRQGLRYPNLDPTGTKIA